MENQKISINTSPRSRVAMMGIRDPNTGLVYRGGHYYLETPDGEIAFDEDGERLSPLD